MQNPTKEKKYFGKGQEFSPPSSQSTTSSAKETNGLSFLQDLKGFQLFADCGIMGVVISFGCLMYLKVLKVHWIIKCILLIQNIIALVMSALILIATGMAKIIVRDITTCILIHYPIYILEPCMYFCTAQLAVMRFYMTKNVDQKKVTDTKKAMLIIMGTSLAYMIWNQNFIIYQLFGYTVAPLAKCTNTEETFPIYGFHGVSLIASIVAPLIVTIKYSNKLTEYMAMKRNQQAAVSSDNLIPWTSGSTTKMDYSSDIPNNMITLGKTFSL